MKMVTAFLFALLLYSNVQALTFDNCSIPQQRFLQRVAFEANDRLQTLIQDAKDFRASNQNTDPQDLKRAEKILACLSNKIPKLKIECDSRSRICTEGTAAFANWPYFTNAVDYCPGHLPRDEQEFDRGFFDTHVGILTHETAHLCLESGTHLSPDVAWSKAANTYEKWVKRGFDVPVIETRVIQTELPGLEGIKLTNWTFEETRQFEVATCGNGDSIQKQIADCKFRFPLHAEKTFSLKIPASVVDAPITRFVMSLVSRDERGHEVWYDSRKQLVWSDQSELPMQMSQVTAYCDSLSKDHLRFRVPNESDFLSAWYFKNKSGSPAEVVSPSLAQLLPNVFDEFWIIRKKEDGFDRDIERVYTPHSNIVTVRAAANRQHYARCVSESTL